MLLCLFTISLVLTIKPFSNAQPLVEDVYKTSREELGVEPYGEEAVKRIWDPNRQVKVEEWLGHYNSDSWIPPEEDEHKEESSSPGATSTISERQDSTVEEPPTVTEGSTSTPSTSFVATTDDSEKQMTSASKTDTTVIYSSQQDSPMEPESQESSQNIKTPASSGSAVETVHFNNTIPVVYDPEAQARAKSDYLKYSPLAKHNAFDRKIHSYSYLFGEGPSRNDGRLHAFEQTDEYHYPSPSIKRSHDMESSPLLTTKFVNFPRNDNHETAGSSHFPSHFTWEDDEPSEKYYSSSSNSNFDHQPFSRPSRRSYRGRQSEPPKAQLKIYSYRAEESRQDPGLPSHNYDFDLATYPNGRGSIDFCAGPHCNRYKGQGSSELPNYPKPHYKSPYMPRKSHRSPYPKRRQSRGRWSNLPKRPRHYPYVSPYYMSNNPVPWYQPMDGWADGF